MLLNRAIWSLSLYLPIQSAYSYFVLMVISSRGPVETSGEEVFGVTAPISTACATSHDEMETRKMLSFLDAVAPGESEEGWQERWEVLIDLETKVSEWLTERCGVKAPAELHAVCKVLTFGSFRLGIIRPSSDIDTLVLIPSSVSRDQFFSDFIGGTLASDPEVSECLAVTDARVPVAKVKYRGIFLDILVASIPATSIVDAMESIDDSLIFKVDEKSMKSMNGIRVADKILRLVPDPRTFRQATRMIKFWAQQRCIYGNSVGYFGGVSWSMAVARVCQLYPNFSAKQIVERFFYTFASWSWEDNGPVVLCAPSEMRIPPSLIRQGGVSVLSQFRDWNPSKYSSDRFQVMPVITPIFPSHNTTYNVTETQKQIMTDEIRRGKELIQLMHLSGGEIGWKELCTPVPFWDLFTNFLELDISAANAELLSKFKGLVESRMRSLIRVFEQLGGEEGRKLTARPHPEFFLRPTENGLRGSFFLGLLLQVSVAKEEGLDLKQGISQFISETLEKSLQGPEWSEIPFSSFKLEIRCTNDPFPAHIVSKDPECVVKRQRVCVEGLS